MSNKAAVIFLADNAAVGYCSCFSKTSRCLCFDDSFSALDFKTDANLRKALKEQMTDAIVVLVAQRVSTVMEASTILVLDEGN